MKTTAMGELLIKREEVKEPKPAKAEKQPEKRATRKKAKA